MEPQISQAIGAVGRQGWRPQDLANVAWGSAVVAVPVPMAEDPGIPGWSRMVPVGKTGTALGEWWFNHEKWWL